MRKEFPCKEPGCKEKVVYEEDRIPAYKVTNVVYLTCPRGHTHSYEM